MTKMCAGVDFSMTCPAICVHPDKSIQNFSDCKVFFYTDTNKYTGLFNENIVGVKHILHDCEMERFDNVTAWAMAILKKYKAEKVCLEGYSMGSKGKVFNIAENTGLLKYKMWLAGIPFITPPPTTVKKHFTGKGNAKKELMYEIFKERFGIDLVAVLDYQKTKIDSPIGDIVDAVAMADYMIKNNK